MAGFIHVEIDDDDADNIRAFADIIEEIAGWGMVANTLVTVEVQT